MSHLPQSFVSGEPGSTGREVFEDSTASGPAAQFLENEGRAHGTAGGAVGVGSEARAGGYDGNFGDNNNRTGGLTGSSGLTGGSGLTGSHGHHEGHHHEGHSHGLGGLGGNNSGIQPGGNSQIGDSYGANPQGATGAFDRVGDRNQEGALYERTGTSGPITGGAAGTDRFDSDRQHDRSGVTGNSFGARDDYPVHDTTERAEGKPSGIKSGIQGVLGTSDKDFTGRERTGGAGGAYANIDNNTHHASGHTALTGREGNTDNNPVTNVGHNTGAGHHDGVNATEDGHKPTLIEKAKHAVGL